MRAFQKIVDVGCPWFHQIRKSNDQITQSNDQIFLNHALDSPDPKIEVMQTRFCLLRILKDRENPTNVVLTEQFVDGHELNQCQTGCHLNGQRGLQKRFQSMTER